MCYGVGLSICKYKNTKGTQTLSLTQKMSNVTAFLFALTYIAFIVLFHLNYLSWLGGGLVHACKKRSVKYFFYWICLFNILVCFIYRVLFALKQFFSFDWPIPHWWLSIFATQYYGLINLIATQLLLKNMYVMLIGLIH